MHYKFHCQGRLLAEEVVWVPAGNKDSRRGGCREVSGNAGLKRGRRVTDSHVIRWGGNQRAGREAVHD